MSDQVTDEQVPFGHTGGYTVLGATATASVVTVFSGKVSLFTGKKLIHLVSTNSKTLTYAIYGNYSWDANEGQLKVLADAGTDTRFEVLETGSIVSTGTDRTKVVTSDPLKWLLVTVVGNGATYNLDFSGS